MDEARGEGETGCGTGEACCGMGDVIGGVGATCTLGEAGLTDGEMDSGAAEVASSTGVAGLDAGGVV